MGLDKKADASDEKPESEMDSEGKRDPVLRICLREHPEVLAWFERLYRLDGGTAENFGGCFLILSPSQLNAFEVDARNDVEPRPKALVFGERGPERRTIDLAFIAEARARIAEGEMIFHISWW